MKFLQRDTKIHFYSIRDKLVEGKVSPPFMSENDSVAKRQYKEIIKDFPVKEDFELVYLGSVDIMNAKVITVE